jgi:hypothetical protein
MGTRWVRANSPRAPSLWAGGHRAGFPSAKDLAEFDFAAVPKLNKKRVVDELGYLPLDKRGAEHLFRFFSQCYERTGLIVTTSSCFL